MRFPCPLYLQPYPKPSQPHVALTRIQQRSANSSLPVAALTCLSLFANHPTIVNMTPSRPYRPSSTPTPNPSLLARTLAGAISASYNLDSDCIHALVEDVDALYDAFWGPVPNGIPPLDTFSKIKRLGEFFAWLDTRSTLRETPWGRPGLARASCSPVDTIDDPAQREIYQRRRYLNDAVVELTSTLRRHLSGKEDRKDEPQQGLDVAAQCDQATLNGSTHTSSRDHPALTIVTSGLSSVPSTSSSASSFASSFVFSEWGASSDASLSTTPSPMDAVFTPATSSDDSGYFSSRIFGRNIVLETSLRSLDVDLEDGAPPFSGGMIDSRYPGFKFGGPVNWELVDEDLPPVQTAWFMAFVKEHSHLIPDKAPNDPPNGGSDLPLEWVLPQETCGVYYPAALVYFGTAKMEWPLVSTSRPTSKIYPDLYERLRRMDFGKNTYVKPYSSKFEPAKAQKDYNTVDSWLNARPETGLMSVVKPKLSARRFDGASSSNLFSRRRQAPEYTMTKSDTPDNSSARPQARIAKTWINSLQRRLIASSRRTSSRYMEEEMNEPVSYEA